MVNLSDYASLSAGGTNWTPAINAAFAASRSVEIDYTGTNYPFATGFEIPEFAELRGRGKPTLTFAANGITQRKHSVLSNVICEGPGKATSTTGHNLSGDHMVTEKCIFRYFGTLWQGNNPDTYITTSRDCTYAWGAVAVDMWLDGSLTAGEKILFDACTFANNDVLWHLQGSFLDTFWMGCSFDYNTDFGTISNGQHHFIGGHIETNATQTTQGFLFRKTNGAQVQFTGVRFGMVGVPYVVDRATEGTSGYVRYTNCPSNSLAVGGASFVSRSAIYQQLGNGVKELTFHTPFASRTAYPSVALSGHTGNPVQALAAPLVTMNPANTEVTVSLPVAQASGVGVLVDFG
jgi:hypothetical protein